MALQSLEGAGMWVPTFTAPAWAIGNITYVLDATGEKCALVCRAPKAGDIDRFDFLIGAVGNSPDNGLRASLQGVNLADGQPDGTILGATNGAHVTYAHSVTTGWKSTNFGEVATVTRNQLIACVIDIPSFTVSDSVSISSLALGAGTNVSGFPYGISATSTKTVTQLPIIALHYTDGYAYVSPQIPAVQTVTTLAYNSGTAVADEWGLGFQVPFPCKLNAIGVSMAVAAAGDFEVLVYNAANTIVATTTHDGDVTGIATACGFILPIQTELALTANSTYRVTIRPTSANSITLQYVTFVSAEVMHTMEGGDNFYMTSQINQGLSWTDYNSGTFRRPRISLHLTAFDDAASGGGAAPIFVIAD